MGKRKRYTDDFRASAVLMLEAAGYPDRDGSLTAVSNRLNVPMSTLRRWFLGTSNPPPANIGNEKRFDMRQAIQDELAEIFKEMGNARQEATYRDLGWVAGVLFDKRQILDGQPTWRVEIVNMLKDGSIPAQVVIDELGDELASELFDAAGVSRLQD